MLEVEEEVEDVAKSKLAERGSVTRSGFARQKAFTLCDDLQEKFAPAAAHRAALRKLK